MKTYFNTKTNAIIYAGETREIKAIYNSISRNRSTDISPLFCKTPYFSEKKQCYAICITSNKSMTVLSSDTFASMLVNDELKLLR